MGIYTVHISFMINFSCLRKGTNSKIVYFVRNIWRYCTPKYFCRSRLCRELAKLESRPDREYIQSRVDYYNKLKNITPLNFDTSHLLGDHKFRGSMSAYFFDSYEYTRWFDNSLRWSYLFGDIIHVPDVPTIVKSRPIHGDNVNSVLLNLDKARHFTFLHDSIPFRKKQNRAIFRLAITAKPHRIRFVQLYFGHPMCDVGIISPIPEFPKEWTKKKITLYQHLVYKFVLALEGNDVATNLKWIMSTNSVAVMPRPTYETWFMEGTLIPNYHYIEIKSDYSDMPERLQYYIDHPQQAEAIISHAHEYIAQFRDEKRERLISLLVLQKYFSQTGQF